MFAQIFLSSFRNGILYYVINQKFRNIFLKHYKNFFKNGLFKPKFVGLPAPGRPGLLARLSVHSIT
ncbi:TPA: hypothetical protein DCZ16_02460 [Candidatus Peregrinibacteria bacterium]|nr:hypothetical protein [Candidatus Peregrinibacteria bacterium]